jgi:putative transposase
MSKATSSSTGHRYGLVRVSRVWGQARATVYRHRDAAIAAVDHRRRGPVGACPDADLVEHIREQILASRFHGEGYRKIWARLRFAGIRTSARRVRRLMGANGLLAPHRVGQAGAKLHDGTIVTDAVNVMWGTDMTETVTLNEGVARVFIAIDHANSELVGIHASKSGNRFEALEPIRQGVLRHFGTIGSTVAAGLKLRHDHGSNYMSADFQAEIKFLGIESSPSFVREPEGNGVAERFMRTLKENLLWVQAFDTIEHLRTALLDFARRYNETWLVARHGYRTPAQVRKMQLQTENPVDEILPLAA